MARKLRHDLVLIFIYLQAVSLNIRRTPASIVEPYNEEALQDIVKWDQHSVFVRGERVLFFRQSSTHSVSQSGRWLDVVRMIGF